MPDTPIEICILYRYTDQPWGGGNQFLRALAVELKRMGHRVTMQPTLTTQVVLISGFHEGPGRYLRPRKIAQLRQAGKFTLLGNLLPVWLHLQRKRTGPILIHRVDGVPNLTRGGYKTQTDTMMFAINRLTDYTIFQSKFCQTTFTKYSNAEPPANYRVIKNAIDPQIFLPDESITPDDGPFQLVATSWSNNPRKGFTTLAEISCLPDIKLTFVGNWPAQIDPKQVKRVGAKKSEELAAILRTSHVMVHAAWNEPCSNSMIEALASGLPVIYRDSGGNRELSGKYGIPLSNDPATAVNTMRERYDELRKKVLRHRNEFLIDRAAQEYLTAFRYAIANYPVARD